MIGSDFYLHEARPQDGAAVVVGAGPAGIRAAQTLLAHGVKPVVIDEYVKVTKSFYLGKEGGFVNGVLDKIGTNLPSIKEKFSFSG